MSEKSRSTELQHLGVVGLALIHELSTPISSAVMSLQLLAEEIKQAPDMDQAVLVERLMAEADRIQGIGHLVNRFRHWLHEKPMVPERLNLRDIFWSTVEMIHPALREANLPRPSRREPQEEVWVSADRIWLERVFSCVLINAAQAAQRHRGSQGEVEYQVWCENGHAYVRISDNGPGLSIEDPFELGQTKTKNGIGFGLYLAKRLITSMGGQIEFENNCGEHSTACTISLKTQP